MTARDATPRLALIGMGRMGRTVAALAAESGWPVVATIGRGEGGAEGITAGALAGADVAIEFTVPGAAADNAIACLRAGCPVVVGTTGWRDQLPRVERAVRDSGGALLHAPNFSLGVNLFWHVAEVAARLAARLPRFDAHVVEHHHTAKRDAPSGTAIELQRRVSAAMDRDVPVTSVRVGSVPGTHQLILDGTYEQLLLEHAARDRRVFAEGALAAARWLIGRTGVFTMRDLIEGELST